jgi:transcriptional regulator with XRE-family HTH domain
MVKNRISHLRKAAKLTQSELAERVGTSQQQIQRLEAGVVTVRLDLAVQIANALGVTLRAAFPSLPRSATMGKREKTSFEDLKRNFADAGIDSDPRVWTIKLFMFDGRVLLYETSSEDKARLESIVSSSSKKFLAFDSKNKAVAVNRTKIAACQFLYDPPSVRDKEGEDDEYELKLHLVSAPNPLSFDLEPDSKTPEEDGEGFQAQLQYLLINIDGADGVDDEVFWFDDADGERVYIRGNELLSIEVPLVCCEPSLWKKSLESLDDAEALAEKSRHRSAKSKP